MKNLRFSLKFPMNSLKSSPLPATKFYFYLGAIVLFFALIRLAGIAIPSLQWTAWKEIDYISISTNYIENRFKFHEPTITWPAEPPRVTAMEFPLVPYLSAFLYRVFGFNPITVRFITLLSFLLIIWFTGLFARKIMGQYGALMASAFAGFIPLNSPFGNFQFSEPLLFASSLMALYFFYRYTEENNVRLALLSFGLLSLALLLKPTELYIALPMVWLWFRKHLFHFRPWLKLSLWFLAAFILPFIWYVYAWHLTKTSIDVFGVFGGHDKFQTLTMLSQKSWYAAMFHSIWSLFGGAAGFLLFLAGALYAILDARKYHLPIVWLIGVVLFFVIVAEGNIDAPYRQLAIVPVAAMLMTSGLFVLFVLLTRVPGVGRLFGTPVASVLAISLIILVSGYKYLVVKKDAPFHPVEWEVARHIKEISGPGDHLITAGTYTIHKGGNDLSPVLYYYSGLQGWTLQKNEWNEDKIGELKAKGGTVFAATYMLREPEMERFVLRLAEKYKVIYYAEDRQSMVLDLRNPFSQ
jgi:4-amino-4-deoxy-L-arabinose transferase-like glycosyltransferase